MEFKCNHINSGDLIQGTYVKEDRLYLYVKTGAGIERVNKKFYVVSSSEVLLDEEI